MFMVVSKSVDDETPYDNQSQKRSRPKAKKEILEVPY